MTANIGSSSVKTQLHIMSIGGDNDQVRHLKGRSASSSSAFRSTLKSPRNKRCQSAALKLLRNEIRSPSYHHNDLQLNLQRGRVGLLDPTVSTQVSLKPSSHAIQNSVYPLGAHFSGYYSKLKHNKQKNKPNINFYELIRDDRYMHSREGSAEKQDIKNNEISLLDKVSPELASSQPKSSSVSEILDNRDETEDKLTDEKEKEIIQLLLHLTDADQQFGIILRYLKDLANIFKINCKHLLYIIFSF